MSRGEILVHEQVLSNLCGSWLRTLLTCQTIHRMNAEFDNTSKSSVGFFFPLHYRRARQGDRSRQLRRRRSFTRYSVHKEAWEIPASHSEDPNCLSWIASLSVPVRAWRQAAPLGYVLIFFFFFFFWFSVQGNETCETGCNSHAWANNRQWYQNWSIERKQGKRPNGASSPPSLSLIFFFFFRGKEGIKWERICLELHCRVGRLRCPSRILEIVRHHIRKSAPEKSSGFLLCDEVEVCTSAKTVWAMIPKKKKVTCNRKGENTT